MDAARPLSHGAPQERRSSLEQTTKLVTPDVRAGWVLGLYPDAGEASGTFHYRSHPDRCASVGPALDPERSAGEAARRASGMVRRFVAANRLDRLGTLTYRGVGLHDERVLRRHVAHFFKRVRYELVEEPYPYLWVPEWHKTDHGLHVHFGVDRYLPRDALAEMWGRGFVHIKRLGRTRIGTLASARSAASYLSKYVGKSFEQHERAPGLHRYECAQGFKPKVERIVASSKLEAIELASHRMGRSPTRIWHSPRDAEWQGPPALWMAWND